MSDINTIKKAVNNIVQKYNSRAKRISQNDSIELSNAINALVENIKDKNTLTKRLKVFKVVELIIDIILNSSIQNIDKLIQIMMEIEFFEFISTSSNKKIKNTTTKDQYELTIQNMFKKIFDFVKCSKVEIKEPILSKFHDKLKNIKSNDFFLFDFDKVIIKAAEHYLNDTPKNRQQRQIIKNIYKKTSQSCALLSIFCKLNTPSSIEVNINFILELEKDIKKKVEDVVSFNERVYTGIISYIEEKVINHTKMDKLSVRHLIDSFEYLFLYQKSLLLNEYIIIMLDIVNYLYDIHNQIDEEFLCLFVLNTLRQIKNEENNSLGLDFIRIFLTQLTENLSFESFVGYDECTMALFALYKGNETKEHMETLNKELFVYCNEVYNSIKNILFLFIKREDKIEKNVKFRLFERMLDLN